MPAPTGARGRNAAGLTDLHVSILKNDFPRVRKILRQHQDNKQRLEVRDNNGLTPLMVATLMGRLNIANYLLAKRALIKTKDDKGRTAFDYARTTPFTKEKVLAYERLGFAPLSRSGHRGRRKIRAILRHPEGLRASRRAGDNTSSNTYTYCTGKHLLIMQPVAIVAPGGNFQDATAGWIASLSAPGIRMTAVSGWCENDNVDPKVLNNVEYTKLVLHVAKLMNFEIPKSYRDNGSVQALPEHKGRFHACHVEKKLAVWWVREVLREVLFTENMARMKELKDAEIPKALAGAKIFLDHRSGPCKNCLDFLAKIRRVTGIVLCTEMRHALTRTAKAARAPVGLKGCPNCDCYKCHQARQVRPLGEGNDPEPSTSTADGDGEQSENQELIDDDAVAGSVGVTSFHDDDHGDDDNAEDDAAPMAPPKRGGKKKPAQHTNAPSHWRKWISGDMVVAKPIARREEDPTAIQHALESSVQRQRPGSRLRRSSTRNTTDPLTSSNPAPPPSSDPASSSQVEPISNVQGRSAFFMSPSPAPFQGIDQLPLRLKTPPVLATAQQLRASSPSPSAKRRMKIKRLKLKKMTLEQSRKKLDLGRFTYRR
ncbi:hypothetical protein B0T17DRAFT_504705 [Bombardia bombarda]|uniref:Single-strand DNA deaminase toxin A-like C-terminal domain-containing protein n=1 Tax=Bombardia bombarda TaxID=252184 RepID=A0AA39XNV3_9PEZI|nr:hypothetical protein B0T17DRAFT_504705 [Bombardia bombarda]